MNMTKIPRHTSQNSIAAGNLECNFGYVTENGVNSNCPIILHRMFMVFFIDIIFIDMI